MYDHSTLANQQPRSIQTIDLAVAGFLARYTGNTRSNYEVTLKLLWEWSASKNVDMLEGMRRPILELFIRYLEDDRKNMPSSVAHHLSIIRMFYMICEVDGYIAKSPATHVRMPKVYMDESRTLSLDRMELGSVLQAAKVSHVMDAALIALMGMLGLRVSEACNVKIEDYQDIERGHRILKVIGKGQKPASIPVPVSVLRLMDAAKGDRTTGFLLLRTTKDIPMNRKAATLAVTRICTKAGIIKHITPHGLRHAYVTAALDAGVPLRDVQIGARHSDPRVTARYDRARHNHDRHANHTVAAFLAGPD